MLAKQVMRVGLMAAVVVTGVAAEAQAGLFRDAAYGLGQMGFTYAGRSNALSQGIDVLAVTDFDGNPLDLFRDNVFDFGPWDVELNGPLSVSFSTSTRGVDQLDLAVRTALDSRAAAEPLTYLFNYDAGSQSTSVEGSLYLDSSLSINEWGFYDITLEYSSRQLIDPDGRVADQRSTDEFDIGPINISGNLYADILAVLTQPLFDLAGYENPFANFSNQGQLASLFSDLNKQELVELKTGTLSMPIWSGGFVLPETEMMSLSASPVAVDASGRSVATVPEPTVLVLMLAGASVACMRRRIHH